MSGSPWAEAALSVLALIGAVLLAGIVVNNAIVLVDAVNRRRRAGQDLDAALVAGAPERLRPILMTSATTILALVPMALGWRPWSRLGAAPPGEARQEGEEPSQARRVASAAKRAVAPARLDHH